MKFSLLGTLLKVNSVMLYLFVNIQFLDSAFTAPKFYIYYPKIVWEKQLVTFGGVVEKADIDEALIDVGPSQQIVTDVNATALDIWYSMNLHFSPVSSSGLTSFHC